MGGSEQKKVGDWPLDKKIKPIPWFESTLASDRTLVDNSLISNWTSCPIIQRKKHDCNIKLPA